MSGTSERRWLRVGLRSLALLAAAYIALDLFDLPTRFGESRAGRAARAWALGVLGVEEPTSPPPRPRASRVEDYVPADDVGASPEGIVRLLDAPGSPAGDGGTVLWVSLDGQRRAAMAGRVPFAFRRSVRVPPQGELWLALNQEGAGLEAAGVEFRVRLAERGRETVLLDERVRPFALAWQERELDLAAWSGRDVELVFEAAAPDGPPPPAGTTPLRGFWGDLVVRSRAPRSDRPNVVMVLIDTLRPDHLGAYGYERATSPHIDALAREGVVFETAISSAPWTDPSVLTLLTGLYPSDVWEAAPREAITRNGVPDAIDTLPEILRRAGYFTMAASDHPAIHGGRFGQGFDVFTMLYHGDGAYTEWRETEAARILRQLEAHLEGRGGSGIFLYLHLIYPHAPYEPPPELRDLFGGGEYRVDPANRDGMVNLYDAEIRRTDEVIGAFRRLLVEHRLSDDLILVLVSDHGEGLWEHGLFEHGNSLYNELLRVPLIFHAPGRLPAGVRISDVVRHVDVVPTLTEMVGLDPPPMARGRSLLAAMRGDRGAARWAYSEFPHTSTLYPAHAIQSDVYKLVLGVDVPLRFGLGRDPGELLALREADATLDAVMREEMDRIRAAAGRRRAGLGVEVVEPSEDTVKKLRSLGYVN